VKDWCISRQLWWGQQIPAWYDEQGNLYVAETEEKARELKIQASSHKPQAASKEADEESLRLEARSSKLTQDEDVLDAWFSSWLWPMEVFNGISDPSSKEIDYYYPTSVLVTGQDIIFFWVARMIMAGMHYKNVKPFSDVYFTGMVRDKLGRKMSKQLGNSPDLLELIDKYGADAVRFGIMISSPAGNDLLFDEASLEQGRNFNNKLWNALKLVKMWEGRQATGYGLQDTGEQPKTSNQNQVTSNQNPVTRNFAIEWFENRLSEVRAEVENMYAQFRLSEGLKTIYSLVWDDFCSWYLEWVKPGFEQPIDAAVYTKTVHFFEQLMQLLHPFMPFITEEIYHLLNDNDDDLCVKQFADIQVADQQILSEGELLKKVISALRDARNKNQVKPKETIKLHIQSDNVKAYDDIKSILSKQVNAEAINFTSGAVPNTIVVAVETDKFFIETNQQLDVSVLKEELLKDLQHQQGFLQSVIKKLSNERFVANAKPEVVALEKKKQSDAEARIKVINESLANL
jgi:valyl-tRNA synthetase